MGTLFLVTVDGKDFETDKQGNVKIFWGHKLKNSSLHYEFAFCIMTSWLVWINGLFPCSDWSDISIFPSWFESINLLDKKEHMEADDGYIGEDPKLIKVAKKEPIISEMRNIILKQATACLQKWDLSQQYTNDLTNHSIVL